MTSSSRARWHSVLVTAVVCLVAGVLVFLGRWIVHTQENSATLAAAERLVMILEDHRSKHGHFPQSLTNLFGDSESATNRRPPKVLDRFEYRTDGRSYELKFDAGHPVVLNRKDNGPAR
ncbi:MAG: hypothetical protein H7X97_10800 [Opitutaceae bacterium]|nr:hypothetical protein [Verrucomicrobiales bacterium]